MNQKYKFGDAILKVEGKRWHDDPEVYALIVEIEKYEAIIADMAKMLELRHKSEGVVIDMIAAAVKAEREACAKVCDGWMHADGNDCAAAIRARSEQEQPR